MNIYIDTFQTDSPVCPYCGATSTDLEGFLNETSGDDQCSECGKWYSWDAEYDVKFFTREIDWLEKWKQYNISQIQRADLNILNKINCKHKEYCKDMYAKGGYRNCFDNCTFFDSGLLY